MGLFSQRSSAADQGSAPTALLSLHPHEYRAGDTPPSAQTHWPRGARPLRFPLVSVTCLRARARILKAPRSTSVMCACALDGGWERHGRGGRGEGARGNGPPCQRGLLGWLRLCTLRDGGGTIEPALASPLTLPCGFTPTGYKRRPTVLSSLFLPACLPHPPLLLPSLSFSQPSFHARFPPYTPYISTLLVPYTFVLSSGLSRRGSHDDFRAPSFR